MPSASSASAQEEQPQSTQERSESESVLDKLEGLEPEQLKARIVELTTENVRQESARSETERRVQEYEREVEELKTENWKLRIDEVTGLERRLHYYKQLNSEIQSLIEKGALAELVNKEELTQDDLRVLDEVPLSVTQSDIGYLSKYNEDPKIAEHYGEHGGGDRVLELTGRVIQKPSKDQQKINSQLRMETGGYRVGGDEIALIHELTKEDATQVAVEFAMKQSEIHIEGADLPPAVNSGTASLREAVEVFVRIRPASERAEMSPEEQSKEVQKMLTSIADRRAKLAKGFDRLIMMTQLLEKPDVFERNYKWLQKGAFGMEQSEFGELKALLQQPDQLAERVREIVMQKLEVQTKREEDQRLRERAVIVEIADREFLSKTS